jgi:plasmid stability protein
MKTTVELPDSLMTELRIIAAREHRRLREVMEEVLTLGLRARRQLPARGELAERAEDWLSGWQELGQRVEASSVDPRSCVDIVLAERR